MDDASLPLVVSVSGGRTSALMAKLLKDKFGGKRQIIFIFANPSKERWETIQFLRRCDNHFGLGLVCVEPVVHPEMRVGTTHVVRSFDALAMDGSLYESMIQKYGIPNKNFPHCTRELKSRPIASYLRSLGLKKYILAIGYRADEPKRLKWDFARKHRQYYPLAETWRVTKPIVDSFWRSMPFDLELEEHEGNCDYCWKKSINKLLTLAADNPPMPLWWGRMEVDYGHLEIPTHAGSPDGLTFFRGGLSAADLIVMSRQPFKRFEPGADRLGAFMVIDDIEECSESCEPFAQADLFSEAA